MGWIFGSFTKKVQKTIKTTSKDVDRKIEKVVKAAEKLDHITQERVDHTTDKAEKLREDVTNDIKEIIESADEQAKQRLDQINQLRREAIEDFRKTSKQVIEDADYFIENRINLVALSLMDTAESKLYGLEQQVAQDIHDVINHLEFVVDKTLEQVRNELKKNIGHAIPRPFFDKCRKELNLQWTPGALLSDIDLYRLSQCYELKKLNEETPVEKIREVYGQLQLNAARMYILAKGASVLQKLAMEDWLKYGMLGDFWYDLSQRYDSVDLEQLQVHSKPIYLLEEE